MMLFLFLHLVRHFLDLLQFVRHVLSLTIQLCRSDDDFSDRFVEQSEIDYIAWPLNLRYFGRVIGELVGVSGRVDRENGLVSEAESGQSEHLSDRNMSREAWVAEGIHPVLM